MNKFICFQITALVFTMITIIGCITENPIFKDFIGTWEAKDGTKIILKEDSTCIVKKLDLAKLNDYSTESFVDFNGKWYIRAVNDLGYDEYNIVIKQDSLYIYQSFTISGQGLLKNKAPWHFFQFIGDPDDLNEYLFTKIQ